MVRFLNLIAAERTRPRKLVMIDSSKWSVLEAASRAGQVRGQLHRLKEGEEEFAAYLIRRYGAAAVVSGSRRAGLADTLERRGNLHAPPHPHREAGFPPEDIIFDPNILTVGTGIEEHAPTRSTSSRPRASSHAARRQSQRRRQQRFLALQQHRAQAMHAAFLYPPSRRAWTWASSTPARFMVYEDIPLNCWSGWRTSSTASRH